MSGIKNLIPNTQRTKEEVQANTRKGGIASGIARRRKKTFKELINQFLETEISDVKFKKQLVKTGISTDEVVNYKLATTIAMVKEAMKGNVKAFEVLRDTIGEDLTSKVEITQTPIIKIERPKDD